MSTIRLTAADKAALGLLGVAVGTKLFSQSARRLGWTPIMIGAGLYVVGKIATLP
jgi:hypothetical protein